MAHDYSSITTADRTYTPVSDVTPSGVVEEKFTWDYINTAFDTWLKLLAKEHWSDWWFAIAFVDAWTSLTTPNKTYGGVTKSGNSYSSLTTQSQTYSEVTK